jgi:hypothetical protein
LSFKYQEDTDNLNVLYQDEYKKSYGDYLIYNTDKTIENYEITLNKFASTPCDEVPKTNIILGTLYQTDTNNTPIKKAHKLRILYRNDIMKSATPQIADVSNYINMVDDLAVTKYIHQIPTATQFDNAYNPTYDLNWGFSEKYFNTLLNNMPPYGNLYNTYWRDWIETISSNDSKMITGYFNLTEQDIYNFSFSDQIIVDGQIYIVNSINNWNPNTLTQVTLIKLKNNNIPVTAEAKANYVTYVNKDSVKFTTKFLDVIIKQSPATKSFTKIITAPKLGISMVSNSVLSSYSSEPAGEELPLSGDTLDSYTASTQGYTATTIGTTAYASVVTDNSSGYGSGSNNGINSQNFFLAGNNNNMNGPTINTLTVGDSNTLQGYNKNATIIGNNITLGGGVENVEVIGTPSSAITVNISNSTTFASQNIFINTPIKDIIHVIFGGFVSEGVFPLAQNRLKNIHVVSGGDSLSVRSNRGDSRDVIHVIDSTPTPYYNFTTPE